MYLDHFGLATDPFSLTPSLDFLYTSRACNETLAHLAYSLENGEAITLISGPIGIGKTLIVHSFLSQLGPTYRTALVNTTQVNYPELLKLILMDLGVEYPIGADRADLLALLRQRLLECRKQRQRVLIVIDEAQDLSAETLEGVRLLTNLDQVDGRGLQIVLIGQPDLESKIESPQLTQLKQRIRIHYRLEPLTRKELSEYVDHRLRVAGSDRRLFQGETLDEIYRRSAGVPRLVNILCGEALLSAYVDDARSVKSRHVAPQPAPPETPVATVESADVREPEVQTASPPPPPPTSSAPSAPSWPSQSHPDSRDGMDPPPPARPSPPEPRARMSRPQPQEDRTGAWPAPQRAAATEPQWVPAYARRGRNRRGLMVFMSVVCLLIIIVAAWFFFWPRNGAGPDLTGSNAGLPQTALAEDTPQREAAAVQPEESRSVAATAPAQPPPPSESSPLETAGRAAGDRRADASPVGASANRPDAGSSDAPYAVHISSFREPERAESMCASLQAQGHRAFHRPESIQGNDWHRVYVGPFADKLEARDTIARLRDGGHDSYFLIMKMSDAR